jgi:hypothetical protein
MQGARDLMDTPMMGLPKDKWLARLAGVSNELGFFKDLGQRHCASFIDKGPTLLVTFETVQGIQALSENGQPLGWDLVRENGWSHLCVTSDGDTWFREAEVYSFFDQLIDEAFFEVFDSVLFYGAGPCGYAAAAFSVATPGATVVAVQPQATLDPEMAGWDDRFADQRRLSFTDRYGYAPDMLDAAQQAFIVFDPAEPLDAMHAALFTRPHIVKLRMPRMGAALQGSLVAMELLEPLLTQAGNGDLTRLSFARLYRARRDYRTYLQMFLSRIERDKRNGLAIMVSRNVTERMNSPHFRKRLQVLTAAQMKIRDSTVDCP